YLYQLAVTAGIYRTTATNGALVSALHPVVATMAALLLLREKPQGRTLAGALIALGGVALVTVNPEDRVGHPGGHPKCPTYGHPNCSTLATVI
ncbi:MAG: DMT family transporter, partial [Burkholderiales bacterium]|nr:DMT family transporter [Burkholderiales bacterium]